jgi:hypothetical protein
MLDMVNLRTLEAEPFAGRWRFDAEHSNICALAPHSWIQEIQTGPDEVAIREDIVREDGTEIVRRVWARFDGADYPVEGANAVDTMAYTRTERHAICGIGRKDGKVSVLETVLSDPDERKLTIIYNYLLDENSIAHGVAVFKAA